jgi:hypothetical protein
MLKKLEERRTIIANEHDEMVGRHRTTCETAKAMENKLNTLVGHITELDFQIKEMRQALEQVDQSTALTPTEGESDGRKGQELDKGCDKPQE